jgi:hypothetical protein
MEAMRQSWTDDRMDDLSHRMDERFEKVDRRFDRVEADIKALGVEMNMRFDSLQRMIFLGMCGLFGAVVAALIGVLAS